MSTFPTIKCDGPSCNKIKGDVNHWYIVKVYTTYTNSSHREAGKFADVTYNHCVVSPAEALHSMDFWDNDRPEEYVIGIPPTAIFDVCGEGCALRLVQKHTFHNVTPEKAKTKINV